MNVTRSSSGAGVGGVRSDVGPGVSRFVSGGTSRFVDAGAPRVGAGAFGSGTTVGEVDSR
jgi:hypothetical protein